MKKNKTKFVAFSIFLIAIVGYFGYDYTPWKQKQHAIETTLYWCQLNDIPESVKDVEVQIKGSAFTREFIVSFTAEKEVIKQWLDSSPGVDQKINLATGKDLIIKPVMRDAEFGEIKINTVSNTVRIRTYWS